MKTARVLVITLLCALAAAFAAGCGSSSGGGGNDDPAALVPAGAPLYAEATVRPQGKLRSDAEAALRKILRTDDPGAKITSALEDASKQGGDVSFKDDIEPWLGDRVGAAVTAFHGGSDADYVLVIASKDDGKANDALGEATGLRAVRSKVAPDRLGLFYLDVQGLFRTISQSTSSDPQVGAVLQSLAGAAPKTIGAALQAQADQLRVDAVSIGTPKSSTTGASGADVLAGLPADSWVGLGVANLGQTLDRVVQTIASTGGLTGVGVKAVLGQFQQQTGLDLRKDVLSWMGDAGIYVAGTTKSDLRGALVVKTSDPAKTRRALGVLERLARRGGDARIRSLRGAGIDDGFTIANSSGPSVHVALGGDKLVVGVGRKSVIAEAAAPGQKLGSAPAFTGAAGKLGNGLRPSFFLDFQQVVNLIGAFAGGNADF